MGQDHDRAFRMGQILEQQRERAVCQRVQLEEKEQLTAMSAFSNQLRTCLQNEEFRRRLSHIKPSNLSRWRNGRCDPSKENLAEICRYLPIAESTSLVEAFLHDHIPPRIRPHVKIFTADHSCLEQSFPSDIDRLAQPLRDRLLTLAKLCLIDQKLADVTSAYIKFITKRHPKALTEIP